MERYVAIDNVCAWPNLTPMPNGDIITTIFNQPCHGRWQGDVECWASEDEGRSWARRGMPAPHEPATNRMNVAAGLAHNGDLIVIASGHSDAPEESKAKKTGSVAVGEPLAPWVCRSADGGRTWERTETIDAPSDRSHPIPFGDVVRSPDGTLGFCAYDFARREDGVPYTSTNYFLRSGDDGKTWGDPSVVGADIYNETALLCLDEKRWLAVVRTRTDAHLELFVSEDAGRSWVKRDRLTGGLEIPAHLLRLADGRIVMTYGIRHRGLFGVGARLSEDEGETWRTPIVLVDFDDASDGGYPSSVQLPDGNILTAYYANRIRAHARYHMGVLIWTPEELATLNSL